MSLSNLGLGECDVVYGERRRVSMKVRSQDALGLFFGNFFSCPFNGVGEGLQILGELLRHFGIYRIAYMSVRQVPSSHVGGVPSSIQLTTACT